jgi:hypothetical protein
MGWYFAGKFLSGRDKFDFFKKSAEGGCSWGQIVYGVNFKHGVFVEQDDQVHVDWLEKAANQNNPEAMYWLGDWFRDDVDEKQKTVSYFRAAAELGWENAMHYLAEMLSDGEGCAKDLRQAIMWSAKSGQPRLFWDPLESSKRLFESGATAVLDCDFHQLCYSLGWGMYWYVNGSEWLSFKSNGSKVFGNRCLDYYCSCVELQQKSIFTFLFFWNRTTGVKEPGRMIAQMVWEGRESEVLLIFGEKREGWGCILF